MHQIYDRIQDANNSIEIEKLKTALFPALDELIQIDALRCYINVDLIPHDKKLLQFKLHYALGMRLIKDSRYFEALKELINMSKSFEELGEEYLGDESDQIQKKHLEELFYPLESCINGRLLQDAAKAFRAEEFSKAVGIYDMWLIMRLKKAFKHQKTARVLQTSLEVVFRKSVASEKARDKTRKRVILIWTPVIVFVILFVWLSGVKLLSLKFSGILTTVAVLITSIAQFC